MTLPLRDVPLEAPVWGASLIDPAAIRQLENALRLPVAVGGALMPDAHVGYGIPIGGVVALEDAVAPYMVGVDIACRMMMSVFPPDALAYLTNAAQRDRLRRVLRAETRFGIGAEFDRFERRDHEVMEDPAWSEVPQVRRLRDRAHRQLGTSGSGNHFIDAGELVLDDVGAEALALEPGRYFALMSHSGSRGAGAEVARQFSELAQKVTPLPKELRHLAWLPLDTEAGAAYWAAMSLMGRYASANHHVMHRALARALKLKPALQLENHHNFAWRERWRGRDVYVHRKGATPAHAGELGIIPGSQGHDSFVVRGRGSEAALSSASHGAGRTMSRTQARSLIPKRERDAWLKQRDIELLDSGMDEAPQAYKDIREVLRHQSDLVETLATFSPRVVLMSSDGRAED